MSQEQLFNEMHFHQLITYADGILFHVQFTLLYQSTTYTEDFVFY